MLSVHDIAKSRCEKVLHNHEHYKGILRDIMVQIKEVNDSSSNQNRLVYELPWLTTEHSMYNMDHAKWYICKKLEKLGYRVETCRDKVRVDWSIVNELVEARLDHKRKPDKNRKKKVKVHPDAWRFK